MSPSARRVKRTRSSGALPLSMALQSACCRAVSKGCQRAPRGARTPAPSKISCNCVCASHAGSIHVVKVGRQVGIFSVARLRPRPAGRAHGICNRHAAVLPHREGCARVGVRNVPIAQARRNQGQKSMLQLQSVSRCEGTARCCEWTLCCARASRRTGLQAARPPRPRPHRPTCPPAQAGLPVSSPSPAPAPRCQSGRQGSPRRMKWGVQKPKSHMPTAPWPLALLTAAREAQAL